MSGERYGMMSASGAGRWGGCAASHNREKPFETKETPVMRRGTKVHAVLETGQGVEGLSEEEREMFWQLTVKARRTLIDLYEIDPRELPKEWRALNETRFAFQHEDWPRPISGKPDVVLINEAERKAFIGDYKTGYAWVSPAAENLQLRTLAVLLAENFDVDEVSVEIWQPFVAGGTPATYGKQDLADAKAWLIEAVSSALKPNAPATPNATACKYCKARATCEEANQVLAKVEKISPLSVSVEDLPRMLAACDVAEAVIAQLREIAFEALSNDAESVDGYRIKEGRRTRAVTDHNALRDIVISQGLVTSEDMAKLKFSLTDLERLVKEKAGVSPKVAKQLIQNAGGDLIETRQAKPSLAKA